MLTISMTSQSHVNGHPYAAQTQPRGDMFVNTPYSNHTATRRVSACPTAFSHPVNVNESVGAGMNAAMTCPATLIPNVTETQHLSVLPTQDFTTASAAARGARLPSSVFQHVSPFAPPTSPAHVSSQRCAQAGPPPSCAAVPGAGFASMPRTPFACQNNSSAFFSVGNMGPGSWKPMAPTPTHGVPPPLYNTASSAMASPVSTPVRALVAVPDELPEGDRSDTNLVIQRVAHHLVEKDIHVAFDRFGDVTSAAIMRNIHTAESLGTAFVRFATHEQALCALRTFRLWALECVAAVATSTTMTPLSPSRMNGLPQDMCAPTGLPPQCVSGEKGHSPAIPAFSTFDAVFGTAHAAHLSITWARRTHDDNTLSSDERARVRKLFIRNVPTTCTKKSLLKLFRKYGKVGHISIHRDNKSNSEKGNQRNIAFVVYDELGAAERATEAVHNTTPYPDCKGIRLMIKMTYDTSSSAAEVPATSAAAAASASVRKTSAPTATPTATTKSQARKSRRVSPSTDTGVCTLRITEPIATASPPLAFSDSLLTLPHTPLSKEQSDVHQALFELMGTRTGSPQLQDLVQLDQSLSTLNLSKHANAHASCMPTPRGERLPKSSSTRTLTKDTARSSNNGSGGEESLRTTTTMNGLAGVSSDPSSLGENLSQTTDTRVLGSGDFLMAMTKRSPTVPLGGELSNNHSHNNATSAFSMTRVSKNDSSSSGDAVMREHDTDYCSETANSSMNTSMAGNIQQDITVTVRRGGRVQRHMYSKDVVGSQ